MQVWPSRSLAALEKLQGFSSLGRDLGQLLGELKLPGRKDGPADRRADQLEPSRVEVAGIDQLRDETTIVFGNNPVLINVLTKLRHPVLFRHRLQSRRLPLPVEAGTQTFHHGFRTIEIEIHHLLKVQRTRTRKGYIFRYEFPIRSCLRRLNLDGSSNVCKLLLIVLVVGQVGLVDVRLLTIGLRRSTRERSFDGVCLSDAQVQERHEPGSRQLRLLHAKIASSPIKVL
mmetsp:Transcript_83622/g.270269  ORF Transcript_83622/g.270269 Transcript_83622/m.270269 type:complete len:229 (+) Transcript_83622:1220-1906(+)